MPGASNGFTIEQPLLERGTIMGTNGTDREYRLLLKQKAAMRSVRWRTVWSKY